MSAKSSYDGAASCQYAPFRGNLSNMSPLPKSKLDIAADQAFELCNRANMGVNSGSGMFRCMGQHQKHLELAYNF